MEQNTELARLSGSVSSRLMDIILEDADGVKSGHGYDILHDMMIYENWNYEYVGYEDEISWDEAQDMLASGEIDLLTSATMTEREENF